MRIIRRRLSSLFRRLDYMSWFWIRSGLETQPVFSSDTPAPPPHPPFHPSQCPHRRRAHRPPVRTIAQRSGSPSTYKAYIRLMWGHLGYVMAMYGLHGANYLPEISSQLRCHLFFFLGLSARRLGGVHKSL